MKRVASLLLLAGIFTPYSCDVRPVSTLRGDWESVLAVGIPVVCILLYALQALARRVADFMRARRSIFRPVVLTVLLVSMIVWVTGLTLEEDPHIPTLTVLGASLLWSVALLVLALRRRVDGNSLPLLLLAIVGLPVINYFYWEHDRLQYGAWLLTAGYALAVFEEARAGPD